MDMRRGRCADSRCEPAPQGPRTVRRPPPGRAQAAVAAASGRCGAMTRPSGRSSPVSSKSRTPLHSRLQPCSGWCATRRADSRSAESAVGHGGWCWHIGGIFRCVVVMTSPVAITQSEPSVALRASIRRDFASPLLHRLETRHPVGRFSPTALSLRVVRGGRKGLVHLEPVPQSARPSNCLLVRANGFRVIPGDCVRP